MSNRQIKSNLGREALESIPDAWRTIYVAVFIILCIAFAVLAAIEYNDRGRWTAAPFTTLTQVVIGTGTASGLLSLFITEIGRAIVLPSVWLEKKLNENLERSRERRRKEREQHREDMERLRKEREQHREEMERLRKERERIQKQEQIDAYEEGRKAGLLEAQGKQPPSPPWEDNGSSSSN